MLVPVAGLAVLLAVPALDVRWEHHPSHFWLVLGVAAVNVVLAVLASEAATLRGDARLFLVSLALIASAGFLALHALATPGVLLDGPNQGFTIATPVGLLLASAFAAASASVGDRARSLFSRATMRWTRAALGAVILGWAVASLAEVRVLSRLPSVETPIELRIAAPIAIVPYLYAAARYLGLFLRRRRTLPLAIAVAFVLLAEAMGAVAFGRSWHLTWWEWHVLMAVAFGAILVAARLEYGRTRSGRARSAASTWSERSRGSIAGTPRRSRSSWSRSAARSRSRRCSIGCGRTASRRRRYRSSSGRRASSRAWTRCSGRTWGRSSPTGCRRSRRWRGSGDVRPTSPCCSPTSRGSRPSRRTGHRARSSRC
ncbi:MAG: hypothetical protein ACXWXQ_01550 [Actinomycetota bacterium]